MKHNNMNIINFIKYQEINYMNNQYSKIIKYKFHHKSKYFKNKYCFEDHAYGFSPFTQNGVCRFCLKSKKIDEKKILFDLLNNQYNY